jgi:hypothetical protein
MRRCSSISGVETEVEGDGEVVSDFTAAMEGDTCFQPFFLHHHPEKDLAIGRRRHRLIVVVVVVVVVVVAAAAVVITAVVAVVVEEKGNVIMPPFPACPQRHTPRPN